MIKLLPLHITDETFINGVYISLDQRHELDLLLRTMHAPRDAKVEALLTYGDELAPDRVRSTVIYDGEYFHVYLDEKLIATLCANGIALLDENCEFFDFLKTHREVWWRMDLLYVLPAPEIPNE